MEGMVTAKEAAQQLGYSRRHVYRLLKDGKMQGQQWAREWMIPEAEIRRLKALQDEHGRLR